MTTKEVREERLRIAEALRQLANRVGSAAYPPWIRGQLQIIINELQFFATLPLSSNELVKLCPTCGRDGKADEYGIAGAGCVPVPARDGVGDQVQPGDIPCAPRSCPTG